MLNTHPGAGSFLSAVVFEPMSALGGRGHSSIPSLQYEFVLFPWLIISYRWGSWGSAGYVN